MKCLHTIFVLLLTFSCALSLADYKSNESDSSIDESVLDDDIYSDSWCRVDRDSCDRPCAKTYRLKPYFYGAPAVPGYYWRWPYRD